MTSCPTGVQRIRFWLGCLLIIVAVPPVDGLAVWRSPALRTGGLMFKISTDSSMCHLPDGVPPTVVFVFAGRRDRMSVLLTYLDTLLASGMVSEVHLWNMARDDADRNYIRTLNGSLQILQPNYTGWVAPYEYYGPQGGFAPSCSNHPKESFVFVKADDDIVFIDTTRFARFTAYIAAHEEIFLVHGNVINNGVAAHYQYQHLPSDVKTMLANIEEYPREGLLGKLFESGTTVVKLHELFLHNRSAFQWENNGEEGACLHFKAPNLTKGQGRFSINFFGTRAANMDKVIALVKSYYTDDEHALTFLATQQGLTECMFTSMNVAHLSFGTQNGAVMDAGVLPKYQQLAKALANRRPEPISFRPDPKDSRVVA